MSVVGIGVDIIEVARIRASLDRHGERFHDRICTAGEAEYCLRMRDPAPFFAARFAAKEAVSKALGTGIGAQCGWLDIEVRRKASGEPFIVLHGAGAETAKRLGIAEVRVSLSHTEHYACAQAVAVGAA
ncbi:MAG: holo-ACP synthase [Chthoniobacteraceae bacterium]